jgi:hypothetical protein
MRNLGSFTAGSARGIQNRSDLKVPRGLWREKLIQLSIVKGTADKAGRQAKEEFGLFCT